MQLKKPQDNVFDNIQRKLDLKSFIAIEVKIKISETAVSYFKKNKISSYFKKNNPKMNFFKIQQE